MRYGLSVVFLILIILLRIFSVRANRSRRDIGKTVGWMLTCLIPPLFGNLLTVAFGNRVVAGIGYYLYMIGMDYFTFALLKFTFEYCNFTWPSKGLRIFVLSLLGIDVIQILLNPFFHHVFTMTPIVVNGYVYYDIIPSFGRSYHSAVVFGIFTAVVILFFIKMLRSPRIYTERYLVILIALVITYFWQNVYLFSRSPLNRTTIGFGICGLLIYYFSIRYRPTRLIDRMLATIASELPESLFFFDTNHHCVWANKPAMALAGVKENDYYQASEGLNRLFGSFDEQKANWTTRLTAGSGPDEKSYVIEKRQLSDSDGQVIGSFLSVRDNTDDQRALENEMYKATHDSLTRVYNRAGYDLLLAGVPMNSTVMLLIDADNFKEVNDSYGHETGDRILQKITESIRSVFRAEDYICRIGGDEFVVFMVNTIESQRKLIDHKVHSINRKLSDTSDGLPAASVSVGVAFGGDAADQKEWFDHADKALYETKRSGKNGCSFYHAD